MDMDMVIGYEPVVITEEDRDAELLELASIINRGEFDLEYLEESAGSDAIYQLIAAAYRAGKAAANN